MLDRLNDLRTSQDLESRLLVCGVERCFELTWICYLLRGYHTNPIDTMESIILYMSTSTIVYSRLHDQRAMQKQLRM